MVQKGVGEEMYSPFAGITFMWARDALHSYTWEACYLIAISLEGGKYGGFVVGFPVGFASSCVGSGGASSNAAWRSVVSTT